VASWRCMASMIAAATGKDDSRAHTNLGCVQTHKAHDFYLQRAFRGSLIPLQLQYPVDAPASQAAEVRRLPRGV